MSRGARPLTTVGFPKPGPAVKGAMFTLFAIWLTFAIALNWGEASPQLFEILGANQEAIAHGEVWRLLTASFMHDPNRVSHILWAIVGLYFFTPSLEERWGTARTVRFLILSSLIAYGSQFLLALVLPASIGVRLVSSLCFGAYPALGAVAIAWACNARGEQARLYFLLPVSSRVLMAFVIGLSVLRMIALEMPPEGLLSPFGGMFAGWLLGASTPSPLRRAYLKMRLAQLDHEAGRSRAERKRRVKGSGFRVIDGGKDDGPDKGPDGKWLN